MKQQQKNGQEKKEERKKKQGAGWRMQSPQFRPLRSRLFTSYVCIREHQKTSRRSNMSSFYVIVLLVLLRSDAFA